MIAKLSTGASLEPAPMSISWISADDLGEALRRSRKLHQLEPKVVAGLNKAAIELIGGAIWSYDLTGDVLTISSASRVNVSYDVTFLTCSCPAGTRGRVCWHSHARDLLHFAVMVGMERSAPMAGILSLDDAAYEAMLAAADEMF